MNKGRGRPVAPKGASVAELQKELVYRLKERIAREGGTARHFAEKHKLSYSMFYSVLNNERWVAHSDKETVIKPLARVLGVPPITVLIYAGALDHMDFALEETIGDRLQASYAMMVSDPQVSAFVPPAEVFKKWDIETKVSFVMMYQIIAGRALLDMATVELPAKDDKKTVSRKAVKKVAKALPASKKVAIKKSAVAPKTPVRKVNIKRGNVAAEISSFLSSSKTKKR